MTTTENADPSPLDISLQASETAQRARESANFASTMAAFERAKQESDIAALDLRDAAQALDAGDPAEVEHAEAAAHAAAAPLDVLVEGLLEDQARMTETVQHDHEDDLLVQASTERTPGAPEGVQRPSWGQWAGALAQAVATRADCSRRQVGAVILDIRHHVVSTGYNGYPAGRPGCLTASACPRGRLTYAEIPKDSPYVGTEHPCDALHAEENAILHAYRDLEGCTMYVTHQPCPNCMRLLHGTNLVMVVWEDGFQFLGMNAENS